MGNDKKDQIEDDLVAKDEGAESLSDADLDQIDGGFAMVNRSVKLNRIGPAADTIYAGAPSDILSGGGLLGQDKIMKAAIYGGMPGGKKRF
ncbi:MAG: hypothetical protein AAGI70_01195 [Pseudomonadota bacterium]